ncbi:nitroreductase family protein [Mycobacterium sp. 852002-10029_SCH5224772]|uniref:nitroreductase family protein n=1 Tax=Mycobacterium sp. 852002-10029_SCH5224772 TaxID=1834083 RepID=UPI001E5F0462|nr:nitroreductase family protein [Mycobacterium sp. 852002-10029_SCH5224772]
MSTDELLTTTRSVRKRLDLTKPVPIGLIRECLEIAVQAPTSGNVQNGSFIIVTDAEQRRAIADVYRRTWDLNAASPFAVADRFKDDPARNREQRKVSDSAAYLAEHIGLPTRLRPRLVGVSETSTSHYERDMTCSSTTAPSSAGSPRNRPGRR